MKELLLAYILLGGFLMTEQPGIMIFDFSNPDISRTWRSVNDTVMGGASDSRMVSSGAGTALFTGTVSLEHSGGFCSVSFSDNRIYNLSGCTGMAAMVRGDGKTYKLTLKNDISRYGFAYQFTFTTGKGAWITVMAPFREFKPRFRGMDMPDSPPIDPADIRSFGLLIGDKQEGPFSLEIKWMKGY